MGKINKIIKDDVYGTKDNISQHLTFKSSLFECRLLSIVLSIVYILQLLILLSPLFMQKNAIDWRVFDTRRSDISFQLSLLSTISTPYNISVNRHFSHIHYFRGASVSVCPIQPCNNGKIKKHIIPQTVWMLSSINKPGRAVSEVTTYRSYGRLFLRSSPLRLRCDHFLFSAFPPAGGNLSPLVSRASAHWSRTRVRAVCFRACYDELHSKPEGRAKSTLCLGSPVSATMGGLWISVYPYAMHIRSTWHYLYVLKHIVK